MTTQSVLSTPTDDYVRHIVEIHFHPKHGTPYWLERDARLNLRARETVRDWASFREIVGFRSLGEQRVFESATRFQPLERFIPAVVLRERKPIWASQTGGTTGAPKHGNWGWKYWQDILEFSDEFFGIHGVPADVNWLFIGPTGPHTTGRLVIAMAERRGGRCFSIDLDPRIVKIFGEEGMHDAQRRYVKHIWDQVEHIVRVQDVGVMFCTSRLLEMLPQFLSPTLFRKVKSILHAGTEMGRDTAEALSADVFPETPIVAIYGTSTTGIHFQKPIEPEDDYRVVYVPCSPHVILEVVDDKDRLVEYEAEGNVATWRLTDDSLIPGFWERDRARRVKPYGSAANRFPWDWVADIYSPEFRQSGRVEGVY